MAATAGVVKAHVSNSGARGKAGGITFCSFDHEIIEAADEKIHLCSSVAY
ncbi:hypothetical protein [Mesorhizobium sp.]|nr:hypothetical protein [Mesorhizobium sp.]